MLIIPYNSISCIDTCRQFWRPALVFACILILFFPAYLSAAQLAAPDSTLLAGNKQAQRAAFEAQIKDIEYIRSVGYTLLRNAVDLCNSTVAASAGIFFTNKSEFPPAIQATAVEKYQLGDRLKVTQVLADYPGRRQGILVGDELLAINNMSFPYGENALPAAYSLLSKQLDPKLPSKFTVQRSGRTVALSLTPINTCDYPIIVSNSSTPFAYATGQNVVVSRGTLKVLDSKEHLASLIAHELAHNIMGHVSVFESSDGSEAARLAAIFGLDDHNYASPERAPVYSPAFEVEADHVSLYLLAMSNFPLRHSAELLDSLHKPDNENKWGKRHLNHPYTPVRLTAISQTVADIEQKRATGRPVYPDLQKLARLRQIRKPVTSTEAARSSANSRDQAKLWAQISFENLQKKDWNQTIQAATSAIAIDPSFDIPYINRGWAYIETKQPKLALQDSDSAIKLNPNNAQAYNNRGYAYQELNRLEEAKTDYRRACQLGEEAGCLNYKELTGLRPDNAKDLLRQLRQGTYTKNYQSAQVGGVNVQAEIRDLLEQSHQGFASKNWDNVIALSNRVLQYEPNNLTALANRAGAYAENGDLTKALDDCNKALLIDPNYALAHHNKGYVYELMGQTEQAIKEYRISCQLNIAASCNEYQRLTK